MATITLRTETTGIRPGFEHVVEHSRRAAVTREDSPSPRARTLNERDPRAFELSWDRTSEGQKHLLLTAWREARGVVLPMNYTPLGDVDANAIEVLFVERPTFERIGSFDWRMRAKVEERL